MTRALRHASRPFNVYFIPPCLPSRCVISAASLEEMPSPPAAVHSLRMDLEPSTHAGRGRAYSHSQRTWMTQNHA